MKLITERTDLHDTYVVVRTSCNVPLVDGKVGNMFRLKRALPTIAFLREQGAKVVLIAHIGRDEQDTLQPVFDALETFFPLTWGGVLGSESFSVAHSKMQPGEVLLAENLRQDVRETQNTDDFAELIASYGEVYVNDAFDNVHREHSSMVGVPARLPAYAGLTLAEEVTELSKTMRPDSPSLFILGGAKVDTKMPLMEQFKDKADTLFVGGVLANDFFKAMGKDVGVSATSDKPAPVEILNEKKIILPHDVVVLRNGKHETVAYDAVLPKDAIYDAGRKTVADIVSCIKKAKFILWNGPLGYCEEGFCAATLAVAEAVAKSNAYSVVGGGDTLAAVPDDVQMQFSFVSTGGGAMLDYLADGDLPGLTALEN